MKSLTIINRCMPPTIQLLVGSFVATHAKEEVCFIDAGKLESFKSDRTIFTNCTPNTKAVVFENVENFDFINQVSQLPKSGFAADRFNKETIFLNPEILIVTAAPLSSKLLQAHTQKLINAGFSAMLVDPEIQESTQLKAV